ncbi:MAG: DUF169 domain-containing protein [Gracilibacteraceae bacterium]|jgi:uncharacterized protein (DUF169 family)/NAD-dependent dihydropyrimidine dehydrogenase PreA subunit|nr:DUF169 domain-containing protein [Gracilibacteraceae bacterium]
MDCKAIAAVLKRELGLRWDPVALKMLRPGEAKPASCVQPATRLRHCQSVIAARRGNALYMPPRSHACPDGAGILGLVEMSAKLRSGELYLLFRKMPDLATAQQMIAERPEFPSGAYAATALAPLKDADFEPDVVIFTLWPEQAMWLCCAQTYATGRRQEFRLSGFNSACSDLVVTPMQSDAMNISLGCYGSRAASEIDDFELYLSLPASLLEKITPALQKLGKKSIPESRRKIYLPPVLDRVGADLAENEKTEIKVNEEICIGCGLCAAFCPTSVLELVEKNGRFFSAATAPERCSHCYTCVGQCPARALQIV